MPSSPLARATVDAERVIQAIPPGSWGWLPRLAAHQPVHESLQGKAGWPCVTPRRCLATVAGGVRVHRM